jgi:hypothetical protein
MHCISDSLTSTAYICILNTRYKRISPIAMAIPDFLQPALDIHPHNLPRNSGEACPADHENAESETKFQGRTLIPH